MTVFDDLDRIPWKNLRHAYGPANDVPALLRALTTCPPGWRSDESPLYQLFGNIWHQGTVYEAAPYAVPFLIELAADAKTPDRVGILGLLAAIAKGYSRDKDFEKRALEAVSAGYADESSDVRFAAVNVMASLRDHSLETANVIRTMLTNEMRSAFRAGLFLLLAKTGDRSEQTLSVLIGAVKSANITERYGAAIAFAILKIRPLPSGARESVMATMIADDLDSPFEELPWDAGADTHVEYELIESLDLSDRDLVSDRLIAEIERGTESHRGVTMLLLLLFPPAKGSPTPRVTASALSERQLRAVRVMYAAMKVGKRIYCGHFPFNGLPDTIREWRALADGKNPAPVDPSLPLLATPDDPRKALRPDQVKVNQRVCHSHFGNGIVTETATSNGFTRMNVMFDDEGIRTLQFEAEYPR